MRPGDIIVGGLNYGTGSSRPAARSLRELRRRRRSWPSSINGLFFRNAVNFGVVALECPGVHAAFEEGHTAEVSLADFTVRNRDTGAVLSARAIPPMLLDLMQGGGLYPHLEREGLIAPETRIDERRGLPSMHDIKDVAEAGGLYVIRTCDQCGDN